MQKIKIVTDSSATMKKELIDSLGISVIPLTVMIDSVIYIDGVTIQGEEFMDLMNESENLPKTSQPPIGEFVELYNELSRDGSQIISIHMAESLSGTVSTARQAASMAEGDVTVIDSHYTDQTLAFLVQKAAQMAKDGATKEEIVHTVKDLRDNHSHLYVAVSKLDNLVKGGRVNRVAGLISNFLNIRLVLEMSHSELEVINKGRGDKSFHRWFKELKQEIQNLNITNIGISYAGSLELCKKFKSELQELFPNVEITLLQTSPIIATHTGSGAFAIMYQTK